MLMQFEGVKQTEITMRSALHHMSIPHRDNFNAIERMRKHIARCGSRGGPGGPGPPYGQILRPQLSF